MNKSSCNVNVQEAKNSFSRLLARAHAGEEIIICKAGKPYAKLVAIEQAPQRELGFLNGEFTPEELEAMDITLREPMNEKDLTLWYDAPVILSEQLADREQPDEDNDI